MHSCLRIRPGDLESARSRPPLRNPRGPFKGLAILLISEDLDELTVLADRTLVLYEGEIVGEFEKFDRDAIGGLMGGMNTTDGGRVTRLGVDIRSTFTDAVSATPDGSVRTAKASTTPPT